MWRDLMASLNVKCAYFWSQSVWGLNIYIFIDNSEQHNVW